MHAWQLEQLGGTDGLHWRELTLAPLQAGEVAVRIEAAALNFLDTLMLHGHYQVKPALPFVPGVELAGIVTATGADCHLKVGQRVAAFAMTGAFATDVVLNQNACIPLSLSLPATIAAVLPIVYPTAHLALHELARLRNRERVLILAAAGGVGMAAIQLAKAHGATVVGVASADKLAVCLAEGADAAFEYRQDGAAAALKGWLQSQNAEGFDVVLDMVGGTVANTAIRRLAWRGRYLSIGYASGEIPQIPANLLLLKQASAIGVFWGDYTRRDPTGAAKVIGALLQLLDENKIQPKVSKVYPMHDLKLALADLAARRTVGKVMVVNPS